MVKITGFIFFVLVLGLTSYAAESGMGGHDPGSAGTGSEQSEGVVNINTASIDQFKLLPGINEVLADSIVAYRDANGPFKSIDDLLNVKGMTRSELNIVKQYLVLQGETTYQPHMGR